MVPGQLRRALALLTHEVARVGTVTDLEAYPARRGVLAYGGLAHDVARAGTDQIRSILAAPLTLAEHGGRLKRSLFCKRPLTAFTPRRVLL